MKIRYIAKQIGANGAWNIFDTERNVSIMKSVSPKATYNKEVAEQVALALNKYPFKLATA